MATEGDQVNGGDIERGDHFMSKIDSEEGLRNALTNTMSLSPEVFERLYLSPKNQVKGDLRSTFANPTPMAIMGFSVAVFPLAIELMGWRGSGGFGMGTFSCSIFFGGMLLIIAGIFEFILGNNFPFLVFMGYGAHFLSFATTFQPTFHQISFYSNGDPYQSGVTPAFAASFGFYPVSLGILSIAFLLGALRTNLVFVLIFISATSAFGFGTASLFYTALGNMEAAAWTLVATGACFFAADIFGWYLFFGMVIQIMELPLPDLPVLDLSTIIKAKSRTSVRSKEE